MPEPIRLVATRAAIDHAREFDSRAWRAALAEVAAVEAALTAAEHLYEIVQMDESVGICLSERAATLLLGDALAALRVSFL